MKKLIIIYSKMILKRPRQTILERNLKRIENLDGDYAKQYWRILKKIEDSSRFLKKIEED